MGLAVSDELRITVRPLAVIDRRSWKDLLVKISEQLDSFHAHGLVIGLPLNLDGTEGPAAQEARSIAEKFRKSLDIPVYLEDERLSTAEALARLRSNGSGDSEVVKTVDSEAAAIILRDFISHEQL